MEIGKVISAYPIVNKSLEKLVDVDSIRKKSIRKLSDNIPTKNSLPLYTMIKKVGKEIVVIIYKKPVIDIYG